jgi:hypothetical protein
MFPPKMMIGNIKASKELSIQLGKRNRKVAKSE